MESSVSKIGSGAHLYPYVCPVAFFVSGQEKGLNVPNVVLKIFTYLTFEQLGDCRLVNEQWSAFASEATDSQAWQNLKGMSFRLIVLDGSIWKNHVDLKAHGLSVDDEPAGDKREEVAKLKKGLTLKTELRNGISYLTIPKGLSVKKLLKIAESLFKNIAVAKCILEQFGDIEVDKTYKIVITRDILLKSRGLQSLTELDDFLERFSCDKQKIIETVALIVLTYMTTGETLYIDEPCAFTYCAEQINGHQTMVGNCNTSGFDIYDAFLNGEVNAGVGAVVSKT